MIKGNLISRYEPGRHHVNLCDGSYKLQWVPASLNGWILQVRDLLFLFYPKVGINKVTQECSCENVCTYFLNMWLKKYIFIKMDLFLWATLQLLQFLKEYCILVPKNDFHIFLEALCNRTHFMTCFSTRDAMPIVIFFPFWWNNNLFLIYLHVTALSEEISSFFC
jgi:hypothetical protein